MDGDGQMCLKEKLFSPTQSHVQYAWTGQLCEIVKEKDKKKKKKH